MKKIIFILTAAALIAFSSCSKSDSSNGGSNNGGGGGTPTPTAFFKCKVNGVQVNFANFNIVKDDPNNPSMVFLSAYSTATSVAPPSFVFTFTKQPQGWVNGLTYVLDETIQTSKAEYTDVGNFVYKSLNAVAGGGLNVVFSEFNQNKDGKITGTFSGSLQLEENTNTVTITEGQFSLKMFN
jgi:hypothetical protein